MDKHSPTSVIHAMYIYIYNIHDGIYGPNLDAQLCVLIYSNLMS